MVSSTPLYEAEALLPAIQMKPVEGFDNTQPGKPFHRFPFKLSNLPRPVEFSSTAKADGGFATRIASEGRAYGLPSVKLEYDDGEKTIVYSDVIIKGIGAKKIPDNSLPIEDGNGYIPSQYEGSIVRFSATRTQNLTSLLGIHSIEKGKADMHANDRLLRQGLRTRALVAIWEYPDDYLFSTDKGMVPASTFKKQDYTPGIEAWAQRCRFRLSDPVSTFSSLVDKCLGRPEDFISQAGEYTRKMRDGSSGKRYYSHEIENLYKAMDFSGQPRANLDMALNDYRAYMSDLAGEIIQRTKNDSDLGFVELGRAYSGLDLSEQENLQGFWENYLQVFSNVLGKQFGIMHNENAFSAMYNTQNISMLAELVDHDVTLFLDPETGTYKRYDDKGILRELDPESLARYTSFTPAEPDKMMFQRFLEGWDSIGAFIRILQMSGCINLGTSIDDIKGKVEGLRQSYMSGFWDILQERGADTVALKKMYKDFSDKLMQDADFLTKSGKFSSGGTDWKEDVLLSKTIRYDFLNGI